MGWFVTESLVVIVIAVFIGGALGWLAWSAGSPLRRSGPGPAEHDALVVESANLHSDMAQASAREAALSQDVAAMRDELVERYEELIMRGNERDAARAALRRSQLELTHRTDELAAARGRIAHPQASQEDQHVQ